MIPLAEGGADNLGNMKAIHKKPCHQRKTQQESKRGKARAEARRSGLDNRPAS